MLSQIKPQAPLLVVALPSIPLSFQPCDHTPPPGNPKTLISHKVPTESNTKHPPIPSRHSFMVRTTTVSDRLRTPNFRS